MSEKPTFHVARSTGFGSELELNRRPVFLLDDGRSRSNVTADDKASDLFRDVAFSHAIKCKVEQCSFNPTRTHLPRHLWGDRAL
jgi:hypothetical protein